MHVDVKSFPKIYIKDFDTILAINKDYGRNLSD